MKSTLIRTTDIFRLHMLHSMYEDIVEYLRLNYMKYAWSIATVLLIYTVYRAIAGVLKSKGQELELEPHIRNIIRLMLRVVAIVIATTTVFFHDNCVNGEFRCPEAYMDAVDRLGKTYMIRLFIPKGEARTLYTMQPELTRLIMRKYDEVRAVK